jgi:hypothetical protein
MVSSNEGGNRMSKPRKVKYSEVVSMVECITGRPLFGAPTDDMLAEALEVLGYKESDIDYKN